MIKKTKLAYSEILEVLKKYKDICVFDIDDLERKSKHHLFGMELKHKFGLKINPREINSLDWNNVGNYRTIGLYGEKYNRRISWSDDGTQPEDETLLDISFPTGAYIFGDDYPTELFQELFLELKGFGPKYTDTRNASLYFAMENAGKVFNSFIAILEKYNDRYKSEFKERELDRLKKEIKELEDKN